MTSFEKIDYHRVEMGWSGAELMRKLGLSSGVYSQWKSGKQNPNLGNIKKLSELFNVSVFELLDDEDNKKAAIENDDGINTYNNEENALNKLKRIIPSLTEKQAQSLLPQVQWLISSQKDQDSQ